MQVTKRFSSAVIVSLRGKKFQNFSCCADAYTYHICRAWYNGSYTMATKPIKFLELHYTMIQFLVKCNIIHGLKWNMWRRGGLMVSAFDSASSGPGLSPGWRDFAEFLGKVLNVPLVPLSTQLYEWIPANLMLGSNPALN